MQPPAITTVVAPPAPVPPAPALIEPTSARWAPHRCQRSVWPEYDAEAPVPRVEPTWRSSHLDDKLAEVARRRAGGGTCEPAEHERLEAAIRRLPERPPEPTTLVAWDHETPPEHAARVRAALALTAAEEERLARNGFVVPERLAYDAYTAAYYDVHRAQLPVYVSADSILHAVYVSHDELIAGLEANRLIAPLDQALGAMHCGLAADAARYPPEVAEDVDLYLTVARSLLARARVPSELGKVDGRVAAILGAIEAPQGLMTVELFGRRRTLDTSQFTPRGHYTSPDLAAYFQAAMWLSRVELNLVSRDGASSSPSPLPDPRETPREAVVALALAELAERTGARPRLELLDEVWRELVGVREDVSLRDLAALRTRAGITSLTAPDVAARLRAAIGEGYPRTLQTQQMPGVARLPVIATVLGPRVTPDTTALATITRERGADLGAAEVGFMLGHDRGLAHVDPALAPRLRAARDALSRAPVGEDLYSRWLAAIRALAQPVPGALPSFTRTPAFADLRLGSAIAAYGQLRHNHVLASAPLVEAGGCEIPDGYVEPAIETYRALAAFARRAGARFRALDRNDSTGGVRYFARVERLMEVLVALSREELANRPLSPEARRFLAMIVERREADDEGYGHSFPIATFDGWYVELFPHVETALKSAAFVTDYATFDRAGRRGVHYLGASRPRLGVFVVDVGGAPRTMVGPVAAALQHTAPLDDPRLEDREVAQLANATAPWARSYTVPAPAAPSLTVDFRRSVNRPPISKLPRMPRGTTPPDTLRLASPDRLGKVRVEVLDHHFVAMASLEVTLDGGQVDVPIAKQPRPVEAFWIQVGAFRTRVDVQLDGVAWKRF